MAGKAREAIVVGGILGLLAVGIVFFWVTEEAWPGGPPGTVEGSMEPAPGPQGGTKPNFASIERFNEAFSRQPISGNVLKKKL